MTIHAFTSFSFSYLNRARILATTFKEQHPDWTLWAVITDKAPPNFKFDEDEAFDRIVTAEELFPHEIDAWLFGHEIVEACTAIKGRATSYILEQDDCAKLLYFDPDIAILNPLGEIAALLDEYAIILTPHQIAPDPKGEKAAIIDNEINSLKHGVFNLGFFAVSAESEGKRFADWWEDRLADWCHDDLETGVFVDQKWCNLVPCFFDAVKILRDPGYNVASWNLSQRTLLFDEAGRALVNGRPLRFFHFTKLGPAADKMTQRYAKDNTEVYELWYWYRQQVNAATSPDIPSGWWWYHTFDNGRKIPKAARVAYRSDPKLQENFPKPFQVGHGSFFEWLAGNTNILNGNGAL